MEKVSSKDGTAIAFDQMGNGPALILVNGATATRSASVQLAEQLAPHFTVFNFDRRGRGDSGDTAPYAVEREIEDIAAVIKAAGGAAFVFGHSSGAVLSLRAVKHGLAIPKLAIYEPPFIIDNSRPPVPKDYVKHLEGLLAEDRPSDALQYFMKAVVGAPAAAIEQMRKAPFWETSVATAHTLNYDNAIMGDTMGGDPATLHQFAPITTPVLVMDGGESPPFQHHSVQALVELLPHAQHRTLAGQAHGAAPEVLAPLLVEFFQGEKQ